MKRFFRIPQNLPYLKDSLVSVGFRAGSALAVGKVIALAFGPAGTALFGQAMNLYTALANIPAESISRAMVREGAASHKAGDESGAGIAAMSASMLVLVVFIFQAILSALISMYTDWFQPFQSADSGIVPLLLAFALVGAGTFSASYFLIWSKTNLQALSATFMSIGGLLGVLILWFLDAGFFACLMGFLVGQAIGSFALLLYRSAEIPSFFRAEFWSFPHAKRMVVFAFAIASAGLVNQVSQYALVHWALNSMGAEKVGLWMAMNRVADSLNIPILAVANSILLPTLAGLASNRKEIRNFLRPIFRQSLGWLVIGMLVLLVLYPLLLQILFSADFVAEREQILWQLFGDFFRSSSCVFSVLMLALGHTRFYFWLETASALFFLLVNQFLFSKYGFACLFITHAFRYLFYWLVIVLRYRTVFL